MQSSGRTLGIQAYPWAWPICQLPDGWDQTLPSFPADPKCLATREASGQFLNAVAQRIPWLIGGAADLAAKWRSASVPTKKFGFTSEGVVAAAKAQLAHRQRSV